MSALDLVVVLLGVVALVALRSRVIGSLLFALGLAVFSFYLSWGFA